MNWLVFVLLSVSSTATFAAKPAPTEEVWQSEANLEVTRSEHSPENVLSWTPFEGNFTTFGYDVYYMPSEPPGLGGNNNRIETGAGGSTWMDLDGVDRCTAENYWIVAYNRGRKTYSIPMRADSVLGGLCGDQDETPPVVTIASPATDDQLGAVQLFSGTATDFGGSGVKTVQLTIQHGNTINPVVNVDVMDEEWSYTATLATGIGYTLSVNASDAVGNPAEQDSVMFSVVANSDDTAPPVLTVLSPSNNVPVSSPHVVTGLASDDDGSGVAGVTIIIVDADEDPVYSNTITSEDGQWSVVISLSDGQYAMDAYAIDVAGNQSAVETIHFEVLNTFDIGDNSADYDYTGMHCGERDELIMNFTSEVEPSWSSEFNGDTEIHAQLAQHWKSRYEWRQATSDVITNKESQFYLDVLEYDKGYASSWSPFVQLVGADNGYLGIRAAKATAIPDGPIVDESSYAGQPYVSGVLTTFDTHPLNVSANGKVTIEVKARMPRGQGVFPAVWLYPTNFSRLNPEIDIIEYIGQTACDNSASTLEPECNDNSASGWNRPDVSNCPSCAAANRTAYDTYATQYHNHHLPSKGKLKSLSGESSTGAIYTNSEGPREAGDSEDVRQWWRGNTWEGCKVEFSEEFHIYTLEWSQAEIVWYIDHIEVFRLNEDIDSHAELSGVNFVPTTNKEMYLTLNFALGSIENWIGAPDAFTQGSMDRGELLFIVDYVRVW